MGHLAPPLHTCKGPGACGRRSATHQTPWLLIGFAPCWAQPTKRYRMQHPEAEKLSHARRASCGSTLRATHLFSFPPLGGGIEGGCQTIRQGRSGTPSNPPSLERLAL